MIKSISQPLPISNNCEADLRILEYLKNALLQITYLMTMTMPMTSHIMGANGDWVDPLIDKRFMS